MLRGRGCRGIRRLLASGTFRPPQDVVKPAVDMRERTRALLGLPRPVLAESSALVPVPLAEARSYCIEGLGRQCLPSVRELASNRRHRAPSDALLPEHGRERAGETEDGRVGTRMLRWQDALRRPPGSSSSATARRRSPGTRRSCAGRHRVGRSRRP